jgi:hypothetical protein
MHLCLKHLPVILALTLVPAGIVAHAGTEAPAAKPKSVPLSGKVLETMEGGGYTYILLGNGGEKTWVAAPQMKATVGQQLTLVPGFEFKNFNSKGLNRKFDKIIFSAGVLNQPIKLPESAINMAHKGVAGAEQAAAQKETAKKADAKASEAAPVKVGHVAKAKGANAYTIAQLYSNRAKLEKKPIVVRGRVVKVSTHIMKKNWIHIQDGTGSEKNKTNNLVVTTKNLPKEGAVVTVKGKIYNRLDFGYGYKYELIVQDAKVM